MRTTHITVYLYHNNIVNTQDKTDPTPNLRCIHCGKLLARARGRILTISNTMGPGTGDVPLGVPMIELKCPSCNTILNILWQ